MLSMQELLGQYKLEDQPEDIQANLSILLEKMNQVRTAWATPMIVTSGLRSQADQQRINPSAPKSKHMIGAAVDISDPDGSLMQWNLEHLDLMQQLGLYFEDFRWTKNWCHYQILPPASGHRIFIPSSAPATAPDRWDGEYDHQFDATN